MNLYEIVNQYKSDVNVLKLGALVSVCFEFNEVERGYHRSTNVNGVKIDDSLTFDFNKESGEWIHFKNDNYGYVLSIKRTFLK